MIKKKKEFYILHLYSNKPTPAHLWELQTPQQVHQHMRSVSALSGRGRTEAARGADVGVSTTTKFTSSV